MYLHDWQWQCRRLITHAKQRTTHHLCDSTTFNQGVPNTRVLRDCDGAATKCDAAAGSSRALVAASPAAGDSPINCSRGPCDHHKGVRAGDGGGASHEWQHELRIHLARLETWEQRADGLAMATQVDHDLDLHHDTLVTDVLRLPDLWFQHVLRKVLVVQSPLLYEGVGSAEVDTLNVRSQDGA
ncbi:hypothetical protein GQ600_24487 [Phytophthora cactorum]|nr:hypothetical protein GQ600_24487 [Phytophthora cactorum]